LDQLKQMVSAMTQPAAVPGGVPSVSYISDDIFDFGGLVDMTGCSFGQQRSNSMDQEVFFSFPIGWTSGMKDVYMALFGLPSIGSRGETAGACSLGWSPRRRGGRVFRLVIASW
jgi:hypothetical protein